jgi:hypothetical protein
MYSFVQYTKLPAAFFEVYKTHIHVYNEIHMCESLLYGNKRICKKVYGIVGKFNLGPYEN